jgi:hypothetical protein
MQAGKYRGRNEDREANWGIEDRLAERKERR